MKWNKFIEREGVDVTTVSALDTVFYDCIRQSYSNVRQPFFSIVQNKVLTHYLNVDPLVVGRKIYKIYFPSPKRVRWYYQRGVKFINKAKRKAIYWKLRSLSNERDWQLKAFKEFRKQFDFVNYEFSIKPWWGIESWQVDFDNMIGDLIKKNGLSDQAELITASLYKPWKKTAILRLQDEISQGAPVNLLVDKYQFLRSWAVVWYRSIDAKWIADLRPQAKLGKSIKIYSRTKVKKMLLPNKNEAKFIDMAPYISFFKDWRDDVRRSYVFAWCFLFDKIAKSMGVERDDLGYLSFDEIESALKTGLFPREIVRRRRIGPCVVTTADGTLQMHAIDSGIEFYMNISRRCKTGDKSRAVQGLVAYAGKVTGVVKIMRSYHDVKSFRRGEILIANTTHPNYLPAMQKALAIVTNEGGTICHAAIVSRELKKPCLVGTKIVTKIFKDGDRVEVDAYHGLVKKL